MDAETYGEHVYRHGKPTNREWETCSRCNYDTHRCPGCGEWLYHGTEVCGECLECH